MNKPSESRVRLLIVPGLHNSGPTHWQSWLQARYPGAVRVEQSDWGEPAIDEWAERLGETLAAAGPGPWLVAAHSFGCLVLARHLQTQAATNLRAALLVAPADPERFGLEYSLPAEPLPLRCTWVASSNDPWMAFARSRDWAQRWGCRWLNLGDAGHINVEAGFGPLPLAARWVEAENQRLEKDRRFERADLSEWSFAV
ncbi:MAG: alpha/beta hydrolase [Rhizobacter sp.]|nr:alpha/beta hydrolase [Rhizobacter sp.]